jgi:hypothetical protein
VLVAVSAGDDFGARACSLLVLMINQTQRGSGGGAPGEILCLFRGLPGGSSVGVSSGQCRRRFWGSAHREFCPISVAAACRRRHGAKRGQQVSLPLPLAVDTIGDCVFVRLPWAPFGRRLRRCRHRRAVFAVPGRSCQFAMAVARFGGRARTKAIRANHFWIIVDASTMAIYKFVVRRLFTFSLKD